jgi:hypothetical protein
MIMNDWNMKKWARLNFQMVSEHVQWRKNKGTICKDRLPPGQNPNSGHYEHEAKVETTMQQCYLY